MNKLSRKDIKMLRTLADTPEKKNKLNEYIEAKEKADKLWKEFREAVVNEEEVKPVEPIETNHNFMHKFMVGDKVRVLNNKLDEASTHLRVGDITKVTRYCDWKRRSVETYDNGRHSYFQESALELVTEENNKRKFKKGDKVRVVSVAGSDAKTTMRVGDVTKVLGYKGVDINWSYDKRRPVVVEDNKLGGKAFFEEHALELVVNESDKRKFKKGDKVRVVKAKHPDARTSMKVGEVTEVVGYKEDSWSKPECRPVIVADKLRGRSFFEEHALELVEEKTQNQLRAEIIEKAKKCVEEWLKHNTSLAKWNARGAIACDGYAVLPYITVDKEKRVVHFVGRGASLPTSKEVKVRTKATCHPNDVFNEHIGKAIALGRALGKDVTEFENAIQPTVAVGQTIEVCDLANVTGIDGWYMNVEGINSQGYPTHSNGAYSINYLITDDTDAQY